MLIDIDCMSLSPEKKIFLADTGDLSVRTFGSKSFYGSEVMFSVDEATRERAPTQVELDHERKKQL